MRNPSIRRQNTMLERPVRARVPVDQTWNLADIYPSPARWAEDAARVDEDVRALAAYQGRLHVDGAVDDGARLYWAQQPHFYMNLYPYTSVQPHGSVGSGRG